LERASSRTLCFAQLEVAARGQLTQPRSNVASAIRFSNIKCCETVGIFVQGSAMRQEALTHRNVTLTRCTHQGRPSAWGGLRRNGPAFQQDLYDIYVTAQRSAIQCRLAIDALFNIHQATQRENHEI
jgi:hypothetical protein